MQQFDYDSGYSHKQRFVVKNICMFAGMMDVA